jgi:hypothetical protein
VHSDHARFSAFSKSLVGGVTAFSVSSP